jgi:hypothetical protein
MSFSYRWFDEESGGWSEVEDNFTGYTPFML